jgi:hypothetical protein
MWPDNRILMCENSFENAFLKDMIVGVAHASPAGSRGLHRNMVELAESRNLMEYYLVAGEPDFSPCG